MDMNRTFLAITISLVILLGYQYFFAPPPPQQDKTAAPQEQTTRNIAPQQPETPPANLSEAPPPSVQPDPEARDITVDTPLYRIIFSEQGGTIKSFCLKRYRAGVKEDTGPMELIAATNPAVRPLLFSLDHGATVSLPLYKTEGATTHFQVEKEPIELNMRALLPTGIEITQTLRFTADSYLIPVTYTLKNSADLPLTVSPALIWTSKAFPHINPPSSYLFSGPAAYGNGELTELKEKTLAKGPFSCQGQISWTGYADSYFMSVVMPEKAGELSLTMQASGDGYRHVLAHAPLNATAETNALFSYTLYLGPKKLSLLRDAGHDLAKAVDYGWFDFLAKPMLWLLNFFYSFTKNYGLAIILLTILIKGILWPLTQKGLRSMKNMQKLQPKMTKIREKYKNDPVKMNQEMMNLYKVYKVNPMGGCLPMLIQVPFFLALYRVLMAAIELRHAPFMLWINDLSMPDRLWLGFDIPWLHGLPVLTLLMGLSMYLQQKMTPMTGDPAQMRIMRMLPIIFTFMFINFASGLVLYWFVNNLLSMLQQHLINRESKPSSQEAS